MRKGRWIYAIKSVHYTTTPILPCRLNTSQRGLVENWRKKELCNPAETLAILSNEIRSPFVDLIWRFGTWTEHELGGFILRNSFVRSRRFWWQRIGLNFVICTIWSMYSLNQEGDNVSRSITLPLILISSVTSVLTYRLVAKLLVS